MKRTPFGHAAGDRRPQSLAATWSWLALTLPLAIAILVTAAVASHYQDADSFCFLTAGRFVVEGRDPYDVAQWTEATSSSLGQDGLSRTPFCPGRFGYPLWTALVFVPLAVLPTPVAAVVWEVVAIVSACGGSYLCWRAAGGDFRGAPLFLLLVATSEPFWATVAKGQFGGLLLGCIGLITHEVARPRQQFAGVALVGLALKPHIAPVFAVTALWSLVSRRSYVALLTGVAIGGTLFVLSTVLYPGWLGVYLGGVGDERASMFEHLTSLWGIAQALGTPALGAPLAIAMLLPLAIAIVLRRLLLTDVLAVALASWMVVTPYAGSSDHLVLVLPWAILFARWRRATVALALVLPWVLNPLDAEQLANVPALTEPGRWNVVVPTATSVALAYLLFRWRQPSRGPASVPLPPPGVSR
jgi:glycosyl transferase family 87